MIRVHLVCATQDVPAADGLLTTLWGVDQSGSFSVPLCSTGSATHYGCSGLFENRQLEYLLSCGTISVGLDGSFWEFAGSLGLAAVAD